MCIDPLVHKYPLFVYGGAGAHVLGLARVLCPRIGDLRVQALNGSREPGAEDVDPGVTGHTPPIELEGTNTALKALGVDPSIATACEGTGLIYSYTWYANLAGHLASLLRGVPHVTPTHSLEPLHPWKAEQLGDGYRISSYMEKTAYEAVATIITASNGMRDDILRYYPGVDLTEIRIAHSDIDLTR